MDFSIVQNPNADYDDLLPRVAQGVQNTRTILNWLYTQQRHDQLFASKTRPHNPLLYPEESLLEIMRSDRSIDPDGGGAVFKNEQGQIHRDDGPAIILSNGTHIWVKNGVIHREDGPAVVTVDGAYWMQNGQFERKDGPAIDTPDRKVWYKDGKVHRVGDLPALMTSKGNYWFEDGKLHRVGKSAFESTNPHYHNSFLYATHGVIGRLDGDDTKPAFFDQSTGTLAWFKNGKLHRDADRPALYKNINPDTQIEGPNAFEPTSAQDMHWAQNGLLHRRGQPARIFSTSARFNIQNDTPTTPLLDFLHHQYWRPEIQFFEDGLHVAAPASHPSMTPCSDTDKKHHLLYQQTQLFNRWLERESSPLDVHRPMDKFLQSLGPVSQYTDNGRALIDPTHTPSADPFLHESTVRSLSYRSDTNKTGARLDMLRSNPLSAFSVLGSTYKKQERGLYAYNQDGQLHHPSKPAVILDNGIQIYMQNGVFHRTDGPAIVMPDGTALWYQNGLLHRTDGAAYQGADGTSMYFEHGKLHRTDGPAVLDKQDRIQIWAQNGVLHRTDGAAYINADGSFAYAQKGVLNNPDGITPSVFDASRATAFFHQQGVLNNPDAPSVYANCRLDPHTKAVTHSQSAMYFINNALHKDQGSTVWFQPFDTNATTPIDRLSRSVPLHLHQGHYVAIWSPEYHAKNTPQLPALPTLQTAPATPPEPPDLDTITSRLDLRRNITSQHPDTTTHPATPTAQTTSSLTP